jgi:hypothetical protein
MNDYLMDADDYLDEQNKSEDDQLLYDDLIADMVDSILAEQSLDGGQYTGEKIADSHSNQVYIELYEEMVRGRGYHYRKSPEEFYCRLPRIKYAYAVNGNLHICKRPRTMYTIPNLPNVEMLAFLINRQIGVHREKHENASAE